MRFVPQRPEQTFKLTRRARPMFLIGWTVSFSGLLVAITGSIYDESVTPAVMEFMFVNPHPVGAAARIIIFGVVGIVIFGIGQGIAYKNEGKYLSGPGAF